MATRGSLWVRLASVAAIVEQIDGELVLRIGHGLGGGQRGGGEVRILVVGGNEDIHARQLVVVGERRGNALDRIGQHEEADEEHRQAVDLGKIEQEAGNEVQGSSIEGSVSVVRQKA